VTRHLKIALVRTSETVYMHTFTFVGEGNTNTAAVYLLALLL